MPLARCPSCRKQQFTPKDTTVLFQGSESIVLTCPKCFASVEFLRGQLGVLQDESALLVDKPDETPASWVKNPGSSPIYWAAAANAPNLIERLVSNGADPSCREGTKGALPLHVAVSNGAHEAVSKLLELGSDVSVRVLGAGTPLELAAANGLPRIVQTLVESHGSRSIRGAMKEACENDFEDVMRVLLENGADPGMKLENGESALKNAARNGSEEVFQKLINHGATMKEDLEEYLFMSIKSNSILDHVLSSGVDPNIKRSPTSNTALHRAVGDKIAMNKLIEYGADVNAQDSDGRTPLHKALWTYKGGKHRPDKDFSKPKIDSIQILISNGADPEIEDREGFSPITKAIKEKQPFEVIKLLFYNGRRLNLRKLSKYDITDVMYGAVDNNYPRIVKILLENGAKVDGQVEEEDFNSIEKEESRGYKPEKYEGDLSLFGETDGTDPMLKIYTDSYVKEGYKLSPLQVAIKNKNKKVAKILLDNNASLEYDKFDSDTPIEMAKNTPELRKIVMGYRN